MLIEEVLGAFRDELWRATAKHPEWPTDPIHQNAIIVEEAGELVRVIQEGGEKAKMKKAAIQVGAIALRFLVNYRDI